MRPACGRLQGEFLERRCAQCDCVGRDGNVDLLKNVGDFLGRLAGPLQFRGGISGCVVLQKNLDGLDYFGRFFSTGLRPPPALRA